jgi:hypothetical protein
MNFYDLIRYIHLKYNLRIIMLYYNIAASIVKKIENFDYLK